MFECSSQPNGAFDIMAIDKREEAYEECAIMKDIFDYFEYIPD